MPKGIYKQKSGKFKAVIWPSENKLVYLGTYDTEEEATSARDRVTLKHQWTGEVEPKPEGYGFIYSIVNLRTEQIYVGRKVYKGYNKFTEERDIPSGWEFYETGSLPVQAMFHEEPWNLQCTILANVDSNDEASWMEHELIRDLMGRKLPSGKEMSLNGMCPKIFARGLEEAKVSTMYKLQEIRKELP